MARKMAEYIRAQEQVADEEDSDEDEDYSDDNNANPNSLTKLVATKSDMILQELLKEEELRRYELRIKLQGRLQRELEEQAESEQGKQQQIEQTESLQPKKPTINEPAAEDIIWEYQMMKIGSATRYLSTIDNSQASSKNPVGEKSKTITFWALQDNIGSCTITLSNDGKIVQIEEYSPYGSTMLNIQAKSSSEISVNSDILKMYRYSNEERDSTGLYYYGMRYYSTITCRWLSADPAGPIDGLNIYAMVAGNPINHKDIGGMGQKQAMQEQFLKQVDSCENIHEKMTELENEREELRVKIDKKDNSAWSQYNEVSNKLSKLMSKYRQVANECTEMFDFLNNSEELEIADNLSNDDSEPRVQKLRHSDFQDLDSIDFIEPELEVKENEYQSFLGQAGFKKIVEELNKGRVQAAILKANTNDKAMLDYAVQTNGSKASTNLTNKTDLVGKIAHNPIALRELGIYINFSYYKKEKSCGQVFGQGGNAYHTEPKLIYKLIRKIMIKIGKNAITRSVIAKELKSMLPIHIYSFEPFCIDCNQTIKKFAMFIGAKTSFANPGVYRRFQSYRYVKIYKPEDL